MSHNVTSRRIGNGPGELLNRLRSRGARWWWRIFQPGYLEKYLSWVSVLVRVLGYTRNWAGCLTSSRPFYYRIPIRYHHYWGNFIGHRNIRGREINCRTCDKGRLIRFVTFNECVNERLTSEKIHRITAREIRSRVSNRSLLPLFETSRELCQRWMEVMSTN